eukprot:1007402-Amorphochlora_amoeboformis.AAC.1
MGTISYLPSQAPFLTNYTRVTGYHYVTHVTTVADNPGEGIGGGGHGRGGPFYGLVVESAAPGHAYSYQSRALTTAKGKLLNSASELVGAIPTSPDNMHSNRCVHRHIYRIRRRKGL